MRAEKAIWPARAATKHRAMVRSAWSAAVCPRLSPATVASVCLARRRLPERRPSPVGRIGALDSPRSAGRSFVRFARGPHSGASAENCEAGPLGTVTSRATRRPSERAGCGPLLGAPGGVSTSSFRRTLPSASVLRPLRGTTVWRMWVEVRTPLGSPAGRRNGAFPLWDGTRHWVTMNLQVSANKPPKGDPK